MIADAVGVAFFTRGGNNLCSMFYKMKVPTVQKNDYNSSLMYGDIINQPLEELLI